MNAGPHHRADLWVSQNRTHQPPGSLDILDSFRPFATLFPYCSPWGSKGLRRHMGRVARNTIFHHIPTILAKVEHEE